MDDKEKVTRLFYRLSNIQSKVEEVYTNIETLEDKLKNHFEIDNEIVEKEKISNNKEKTLNVKKSIVSVKNNLRNYM